MEILLSDLKNEADFQGHDTGAGKAIDAAVEKIEQLREALEPALDLVKLKFGNTDPTANIVIEMGEASLSLTREKEKKI